MSIIHGPDSGRKGRSRLLDYKACFDYWVECGTLDKAVLALTRDGYVIDLEEGGTKPYTKAGTRNAAWIWVIENPDEALEIWQSFGYFKEGKTDEWKKWLAVKIHTHTYCMKKREAIELNDVEKEYNERYNK